MTSAAVAEIESSQNDSLPTQRTNFKLVHGALVPIRKQVPGHAELPEEGTTLAPVSRQSAYYAGLLADHPTLPFAARGHSSGKVRFLYFIKLDEEKRVVANGEPRDIVELGRIEVTALANYPLEELDGIVAIEILDNSRDLILYERGH
jgi:hypothetical protein